MTRHWPEDPENVMDAQMTRKSIEPPNSEICLTRFLVIGPGVGCSGGLLTGQYYLESVVLVGGAEDVVGHLDFV